MIDPATNGVADFVAAVERQLARPEEAIIGDAELARLMNAAVRLYATRVEERDARIPLLDLQGLSTSAVLTAACEMIRQVDVNMFDVAMWFSHAGRQ